MERFAFTTQGKEHWGHSSRPQCLSSSLLLLSSPKVMTLLTLKLETNFANFGALFTCNHTVFFCVSIFISMMFMRVIHAVSWSWSSLLLLKSITLYVHTECSQSFYCWWYLGCFQWRTFQIMLLWTLCCIFFLCTGANIYICSTLEGGIAVL